MGVPVVTLRGRHFFSRMSHGFLTHLGLEHLSAASEADYGAIAQKLVHNLADLQRLRESLRLRLLQSPVCDGFQAAQALEDAYRQAWHHYVGFS